MANKRKLEKKRILKKNEDRLVVYHSTKNNAESAASESSRGESFISEEKNSSRGEYDFAPCSPRRASVCLHTIIVTLDSHCYTVALYVISMIYLCHYGSS